MEYFEFKYFEFEYFKFETFEFEYFEFFEYFGYFLGHVKVIESYNDTFAYKWEIDKLQC